MSKPSADDIVEGQRQGWNLVAQAWEKWDPWMERNLGVCNDALIESANITTGHNVLDLGSGTGHPAIRIASVVGGDGRVTGLDVAEDMLQAARRKADKAGLQNIEFKAGDITALPFDDHTFDAATSRFCLMFLPDPASAVKEIHRTLKNGANLAAAVWSDAEKNPAFTMAMEILKEFIDVEPPDPAIPGVFSMADKDNLHGLLATAGFTEIGVKEFPFHWGYESGEEFLEGFELAAPLQDLYRKLSADDRKQVDAKIIESAENFRSEGKIMIPTEALIVSGVKGGAA